MTSHLVIPDTHAHPDFNNDRFEWLGKLVVDLKPDKIIMLGDWVDMPSLCSYDEGKASFEGRRYKHDIQSGIDAQERFFDPIKKAKKRRPMLIMHEGNHEYRIKRAISQEATRLEGVISFDDLCFGPFGWSLVPYKGATPGINIEDGIAYAHYFASGIMGRSIGGIHPAYQLIVKQYMSCTQGHTHTADYCVRTDARGRYLQGLVAGVYQDYFADFAGIANDMWWRGVIMKRHVDRGRYDPQFISLESIKKEYGS